MGSPGEGIAFRELFVYKPHPMSANPTTSPVLETAHRDRLLRRLIGCFAVAAFAALGLAITTSVWHRTSRDFEQVSLVQDAPR